MEYMEQRLDGYHWVHTINNAEVVAAALLWGEGDFSRTIGLAVEAGLDTDCAGATAGSVFGALHGTSRPFPRTGPSRSRTRCTAPSSASTALRSPRLAQRTVALAAQATVDSDRHAGTGETHDRQEDGPSNVK